MAEEEKIYVHKAHRQHNSLVVVIPMMIRRFLLIDSGDSVVFRIRTSDGEVVFDKLRIKEMKHARSPGNTDRKDNGGGERAEAEP